MADPFTRSKLQWLDQIAEDPRVSHLAFRAAYILGSKYLSRKHGEAWPSLARLADDLGVTPRGVQKALRSLAEAGHLEVIFGTGRRHTNRYRPVVKRADGRSPFEAAKGEQPRTLFDSERVNSGSKKGRMAVPERVKGAIKKEGTAVHPIPSEEPYEQHIEHEPRPANQDVNMDRPSDAHLVADCQTIFNGSLRGREKYDYVVVRRLQLNGHLRLGKNLTAEEIDEAFERARNGVRL